MSTPEYMLVARTVDGQDIELMGISVHIQELNGITLFRVPADTPDEEVIALQQMLGEAFKDMHPERIIVARGGFELRLERIEARPASKIDQYHWLEQKIRELQKERDRLHRELFGDSRLDEVLREWKPSEVAISRPYHVYMDTTGNLVWIRDDRKIDLKFSTFDLDDARPGYLIDQDMVNVTGNDVLRSTEQVFKDTLFGDIATNAIQGEKKDE